MSSFFMSTAQKQKSTWDASFSASAKTYEEAAAPRWAMTCPMPEEAKNLVILDAEAMWTNVFCT